VEVAVAREGHVGRAATNAVDGDALERCAAAATRAAQTATRASRTGTYPGFPEPGAPLAHRGHDAETAALDPAPGGRALAAACQAAGAAGAEASGMWTAGEVETVLASSAGPVLSDRVTDSFMKVIAFAPGGRSGYAARTGVALSGIDPAALAATAAAKATQPGEALELEAGAYTVVMEPPAVAELLWVLGRAAFNGLAHAEGRGALAGRLGTPVVSPAVNLSDSPRYRGTLPRAFDAEGVAKAPLPLIQDGVAHRVVHDTRSGALAGVGSTGHARAAGGGAPGPLPDHLVMVGGGAVDEEELCAPVERGVYVTRLWYTNILRPSEALFTAVTRDGTFLIEDGRITRPLGDLRVTDSALGILARVQALGARSVLSSDGELYGRRRATGSVCPALRAGGVRFTGWAGAG